MTWRTTATQPANANERKRTLIRRFGADPLTKSLLSDEILERCVHQPLPVNLAASNARRRTCRASDQDGSRLRRSVGAPPGAPRA